MQDVARDAGVTRLTVYNQFGSRLGLIAAINDAESERVDIGRLHAALREENPRTAVIAAARESARVWLSGRRVFRNVYSMAAIDPEVGGLVASFDANRRRECRKLAARLERSGALAPGWTADAASHVLCMLTDFRAVDALAGPKTSRQAAADIAEQLARQLLAVS